MKPSHLRLIAALISGLLVSFCFPGPHFPYLSAGYLMPIALVPLFWALEGLRKPKSQSSFRTPARSSSSSTSSSFVGRILQPALLVWLSGIVIVAIGFFWCTYPAVLFGGIPQVAAYPAFAGYAVLSGTFFIVLFSPAILSAAIQTRSGQSGLPVLAMAAVSTGLEIWTPRFFNWSLGSLMHNSLPLSQMASVFGFNGLTLAILLSNMGIARALAERSHQPLSSLTRLALVGLMWLGCLFWGHQRLERFAEKFAEGSGGRWTTVGVVQPNFTFDELSSQPERSPHAQEQTLDNLLDRTRELLAAGTDKLDLIIWPESVAPSQFAESASQLDRTRELAATSDVPILVQATEWDREQVRTLGYRRADLFSASFLVRPDGSRSPSYRKWVPIPFGESVPFEEYFPEVGEWLRDRVGNTSKVGRGSSFAALPYSPADYVAPLICFDAIEPSLPRLQTRYGGATLLVNQSNFVWMGRSTAGYQFKELVRLRAIENARSAVLAANTGPSVIFDPTGRELTATTPLLEPAILRARVPVSYETTPFSIWGLIPLHAFGAAGILVILFRLSIFGQRPNSRRVSL